MRPSGGGTGRQVDSELTREGQNIGVAVCWNLGRTKNYDII
jgi:hypothetical protein